MESSQSSANVTKMGKMTDFSRTNWFGSGLTSGLNISMQELHNYQMDTDVIVAKSYKKKMAYQTRQFLHNQKQLEKQQLTQQGTNKETKAKT